jgi:hypothetical protein
MRSTELAELFLAIRRAWNSSTSVTPSEWTVGNPASGQCAVTALIVQEALGGRIMRTSVGDTSHYFNLLDDGEEIDLTAEQFPGGLPWAPPEERSRQYVLSFPATEARHRVLKARTLRELRDGNGRVRTTLARDSGKTVAPV